VEVANWASPPTEVIEWIGEDSNWPPTDDPIASLLAKQRLGSAPDGARGCQIGWSVSVHSAFDTTAKSQT